MNDRRSSRRKKSSKPAGSGGSLRRWVVWIPPVLLIGALGAAIMHFGELERFLAILRSARPLWLVAAVLLQVTTYASVALGWRAVLAEAHAPQPLRRLTRFAVSKLFADQVIPSAGMSGNMLLVERLTNLGVPRGAAVAALLVSMIGFYTSLSLLAMATLVLLWISDKATPLLVGLVTLFLLIALAIPSLALWLRSRGSKPLPAVVERIGPIRKLLEAVGEAPADLLRNRWLIARVTGFNALIFIADAATLQVCLLALGQKAAFGTAFIAMICAQMVVIIGPVPLGLGSFEATSTGMLSLLGVPVEVAFAGTLLLRGFTLWIPLLPGLIITQRSYRRHAARPPRNPAG